MAIYTGVADANGDFNIPFSANYTSGQKVTVTAEKDAATKSIEIFAPSGLVGVGAIDIQGDLSNFPQNIDKMVINQDITGAISDYAFSATGLNAEHFLKKAKGLELPDGITSVGRSSFEAWSGAEALILPSTLVSFGRDAFRGWTSAKGLVIPEGVESITAQDVFLGWSSATSLVLPSTLVALGMGIFMNWTALTELVLPANLASLSGGNTFRNLTSLQKLKCLRVNPPSISTSSTFSSLPETCVIEVPAASLAAYQQATYWSAHASKMVGV